MHTESNAHIAAFGEALVQRGENAEIIEILLDLTDSECDEIIDYVCFLRNQYI